MTFLPFILGFFSIPGGLGAFRCFLEQRSPQRAKMDATFLCVAEAFTNPLPVLRRFQPSRDGSPEDIKGLLEK